MNFEYRMLKAVFTSTFDIRYSTHHRMPFKLPRPVEQIPVGGEHPALKGIAKAGGNIQHFGIEIADPLHFIFCIRRLPLYHLAAFNDHICI